MVDIPQELIEEFVKGSVILFVGDCLSVHAGLPDKRHFSRLLAERLGYQQEIDLPKIAQYYENSKGRNALIRYLQDQLNTSKCKVTPGHDLISKLPVQIIFTTAYDDLLEHAIRYNAQKIINLICVGSDLPYWTETGVNLVKLHGSLDRAETIVITQQDYKRYFRTHGLVAQQLSILLATKTFVFLGYSLNDPAFEQLYEEISFDLEKHSRRAFIVTEEADDFQVRDLEHRNFTVIKLASSIPQKLSNNHEESSQYIIDFLKQITANIASKRNPSNAPIPPLNFVGRQMEIENLRSVLIETKCQKPVVICGEAGVGKTALAKYFISLWQSVISGVVLWIESIKVSEEEILHRLLKLLGIYLDKNYDTEIILNEITLILELTKTETLIVLDHIDTIESVDRITSLSSISNVNVVITTRDIVSTEQDSSAEISLSPLTRDEGVELLKKLVPTIDLVTEPEEIEKLVLSTGGIPQALEVLASLIRELQSQEQISKVVAQLISTRTNSQLKETRNLVANPFEVSYQRLSLDSQSLFKIIGLLGYADFSIEMLIKISGLPKNRVESNLEELVNFSFLKKREDTFYTCPPRLKEFALELVQYSPDFENLYSIFQDYCLEFVNSLEKIDVPHKILKSDLEHVRAGLQWCLERKDWSMCRQYSETSYRHVRVTGSIQLIYSTDWFLSQLQDIQLCESNLSDSRFSAAFIQDANFANSWITNVAMPGSNLRDVNFAGAKIIEVDFRGCSFAEANFAEVYFNRVDFSGTDLRDANFVRACLNEVYFHEADLTDANFAESQLNQVKFVNCQLRGTNFTKVSLSDADFSESDLADANFADSRLSQVKFVNCKLRDSNFAAVSLNDADFSESDLADANFADSRLSQVKFVNCKLRDSNFAAVSLNDADFSESDLADANFADSRLSQVIFLSSNLIEANFTNTFAFKVDISKAVGFSRPSGTSFAWIDTIGEDILTSDTIIRDLAIKVVMFLIPFLPYLLKNEHETVEKVVNKFGANVWEKANILWLNLCPKIESNPAVWKTFQDLVQNPTDENIFVLLGRQVGKLLNENLVLVSELAALIDLLDPMTQIELMLRAEKLQEDARLNAMHYLAVAREEAREEEPDKEFVAKFLKRMTETLKNAGETVEVSQEFLGKIQPLIVKLLPWLGVTENFFEFRAD